MHVLVILSISQHTDSEMTIFTHSIYTTGQSREWVDGSWVMGQMGHENGMGHMGHGSLGDDP